VIALALVHLGTDQIHHIEQSSKLIMIGHLKGDMLAANTGPVPISKNRPHRANLLWTGCGPQSVPRSVLTLLKTKSHIWLERLKRLFHFALPLISKEVVRSVLSVRVEN